MEDSKGIIVSFSLVLVVLAGYFFLPGIFSSDESLNFYKIIGFLGIVSYISYLNIELLKKKNEDTDAPSKNNKIEEEGRKTTDFVTNISDPNEKYHQLTEKLIKTIKRSLVSDSAYFYLFNPVEHYFRLQHYQTDYDIELNQMIESNQFLEQFREQSTPQNFDEKAVSEYGHGHYPKSIEIKSLMLVPIIFGGFIGFVGVDSKEKDAWGDHDLDLLTEYTKIITQFISQLDNMEHLNRKIDFLREMEMLNLSIENEQDLNSIYRQYTNLIEKYFSYDKLTIISQRKQNNEQHGFVEFIDGVETDYTVGDEFDIRNTICEKILSSAKFHIKDYDKSDIAYRFKPKDLSMLPFKSGIGVSMTIGSDFNLCLLLESFDRDNFSDSDYQLLCNICNNLENISRKNFEYKFVKDLSMIDSLTKMLNHKALKEQLKNEIERCKRYHTKLTYLMIDIDKFKSVNDEHGHLFGDYVLQKISEIIKASVRKIDIIGRYGGEEFGVILVNTDRETSIKTAERIRSNIENFPFKYKDITKNITISIGIASYPEHGKDFHNIIANADQAMYKVKDLDGNKVKMYKA